MRQWEAKIGDKELFNVWTADIGHLFNFGDPKNLDRTEPGPVTGSHILIASVNSVGPGQFSELFVHVVGARARVVTKPDTEVLNLQRFLLVNQVDSNDLTGGFLNLS